MYRSRVLGLALVTALLASGASAQTYRILAGALSGPEPGEQQTLAGEFSVQVEEGASGPIVPRTDPLFRTLPVTDFALQAGDRSFTPAPPVQFEGIAALSQPPASSVALVGRYASVVLRSGGDLVASTGSEVTFRFLEFRSDSRQANYAVGWLGDTELPRRLHLSGKLYRIDQTYRVLRGLCPVIEPPPDSGQIVITDPDPGIRPILEPASIVLRIVTVRPPGDPVPCNALVPSGDLAIEAIGDFALVATAAQPIPIDVWPAQADNRLLPGSPGHVPVAILAARPLDVCPVDERSLRLGDGEAEPIPWSRHALTRRRDVDGDGAPDLVARFQVRDTGIAFGDDAICLVAETTCGETLEGCDAIDTLPRWYY